MRPITEFSIELTGQELLTPPDPAGLVEVDDIGDLDGIEAGQSGANMAATGEDYDLIEIELSPEEMDELLSGKA